MKKKHFAALAAAILATHPALSEAATLSFDDLINDQALTLLFDADGDGQNDIRFSATNPEGLNVTPDASTNMTYVQVPALIGTTDLAEDLRIDFLYGAENNLSFDFGVQSTTEDDSVTLNIYNSEDTLLASNSVTASFSSTPLGQSSYPEGHLSVIFSGIASYAILDFTSDSGHYALDNLAGTFGSIEMGAPAPEPASVLLLGAGLACFAALRRNRSLK